MSRRERVHVRVAEARRTGALHALVAGLLVVGALLFGYAWYFRGSTVFADPRWDADLDLSYIEVLGYAFLGTGAVLLVRLFVRRGAPVYAGWAAGFLALVADDALQLHERAGWWVDHWFGDLDVPGLRVRDLGELAFWAGTGVLVTTVIVLTHRRSDRAAQQHSYRLGALLGLLVVFAVGVDMLHIVVKDLLDSRGADFAFISVEAAGEAGVMAALAAYALHMTRTPSRDRAEQGSTGAGAAPYPDSARSARRPADDQAVVAARRGQQ